MARTRTRFSPSPTGYLHIGGLRTAAYAYALAKHEGGDFILRIEDTDQKREVPGATQQIYDTLGKFLQWDETLLQSDRAKAGAYKEAAEILVRSGTAFYCQCPPRNPKTDGQAPVLRDPCRDRGLTSGAIKLRVPDGEIIKFYDFVLRREVEFRSDEVADTTLLKSDGLFATYHLAVVVDDHFQQISHVLRGPEWISTTPVHVLVYRYLGFEMPQIGHLTSILDPAGGKLSKRKGNVSIEQFLAEGYLPESLLNFVILAGWAPKDNRELFSLEEFVDAFEISGLQKSNPVMDLKKLDWFNGHYIRQKTNSELAELLRPFVTHSITSEMAALIKERITKLTEAEGLLKFFFVRPELQPGLNSEYLLAASEWIENGKDLAEEAKARGWKLGDFFMVLRLAICGQKITPPLNESMAILGKEEVLARLKQNL